jgi:MFS family permease
VCGARWFIFLMRFLDQLWGNVSVRSSILEKYLWLTSYVIRPVIGSFVLRKSWRWAEWTLIFCAIFSWLTLLFMSETYKPVLLSRRRAKRGIPDPPSPFPSPAAKMKFLLTVTLLRPLHMLVTEPIIISFSVYIAFNFGVTYSFFSVFGVVFGEVYGFTVEQSGLVFLSICIGLVLAVPTALLCDHFFYQKQYVLSLAEGRQGVVAPEHRLYAAMFGTVGIREPILTYTIS